jgi:hypothetical protein
LWASSLAYGRAPGSSSALRLAKALQHPEVHPDLASTAVYTALAPNRFKDFWRD